MCEANVEWSQPVEKNINETHPCTVGGVFYSTFVFLKSWYSYTKCFHSLDYQWISMKWKKSVARTKQCAVKSTN